MSEHSLRHNSSLHPVVIFDLDGTLVHDRPDEVTGRMWDLALEHGVMKASDEEVEHLRQLRTSYGNSVDGTRQRYLDPLIKSFDTHIHHKDVTALGALAHELVREDAAHGLLYDEVIDEAHEWKEAGATIAIISGSPAFYIQPFKREYGFDIGTGTRHYHNGNNYLPRPAVSRAKEKHLVAEKILSQVSQKLGKRAYLAAAYGDTVNDLSLLEAAIEPVAINPKNGLMSIARDSSYRIIIPKNAVHEPRTRTPFSR